MSNQNDTDVLELLLKVYNNFKRSGKAPGKYVIENEYRNYRQDIEPRIQQVLENRKKL